MVRLTVLKRGGVVFIDFDVDKGIQRTKYKVLPRTAKPLIDGLLKGCVDERGIAFSDGMGSPIGVGYALSKKGLKVNGIPDEALSEDVK